MGLRMALSREQYLPDESTTMLNQILNAIARDNDFSPFDYIDPSTAYLINALREGSDKRVSDYNDNSPNEQD